MHLPRIPVLLKISRNMLLICFFSRKAVLYLKQQFSSWNLFMQHLRYVTIIFRFTPTHTHRVLKILILHYWLLTGEMLVFVFFSISHHCFCISFFLLTCHNFIVMVYNIKHKPYGEFICALQVINIIPSYSFST